MKKHFARMMLMMSAVSLQVSLAADKTDYSGKWQLVELKTNEGEILDIEKSIGSKEIFQIFKDQEQFESISGKHVARGKWKLSGDKKTLSITIDGLTDTFRVVRSSRTTRVLAHESLGTLTYERR